MTNRSQLISSPVDPSERAILYKVSQRKSTGEIDSLWDRTSENYAVMRMSEKDVSGRQSVTRSLSRASHVLSRSERQLALAQQL